MTITTHTDPHGALIAITVGDDTASRGADCRLCGAPIVWAITEQRAAGRLAHHAACPVAAGWP